MNVDKMTVDKMTVEEMTVDKMTVDEMKCRRENLILSSCHFCFDFLNLFWQKKMLT
jgi:hypothetical protein